MKKKEDENGKNEKKVINLVVLSLIVGSMLFGVAKVSANSEITKAQKNLEFNANTTVLNDVISDSPFPEYESKYVVHLESNQTLHLKNIDFQRDNGIKTFVF